MIYLINDVCNGDICSNKTKTLFVCQSEAEVLEVLSEVKNLKKFKGEIKVIKVVL